MSHTHSSISISGSPKRSYHDAPGLEGPSSPTSSTASESRSPPSVRKRSQGRPGKEHVQVVLSREHLLLNSLHKQILI